MGLKGLGEACLFLRALDGVQGEASCDCLDHWGRHGAAVPVDTDNAGDVGETVERPAEKTSDLLPCEGKWELRREARVGRHAHMQCKGKVLKEFDAGG